MSQPGLRIRWSEHEARKAYARPFGVSFIDRSGELLGSVAVSGADLLYHRQFQAAVLALTGELFVDAVIGASGDPQVTWLDQLSTLLPGIDAFSVHPESAFEHDAGRVFRFAVRTGERSCLIDAPALADYQEFQATLAHQTGALYRNRQVEDITDHNMRHAAWWEELRRVVARPADDEAMSAAWPWR